MNKLKLAENEYERVAYEIQQLEEGEGGIVRKEVLEEMFLEKVLFYRRQRNQEKMEESLRVYLKCRSG